VTDQKSVAIVTLGVVEPARPDEVPSSLDLATFESAARPHYDQLVRRLIVILGDRQEAEDIAQDTYLRAFRSWPRFDGKDVRGWLHTIALRLAFNSSVVDVAGVALSVRPRRPPGRTILIRISGTPFMNWNHELAWLSSSTSSTVTPSAR
jgi:hypothetical protein